jgi:hypothetical protein
MGRACNMNGERWNPYMLLMGKPEGKRPLGRPRHRWGITLRWMLETYILVLCVGSIWLRTRSSGGLL